MTTASHPLVSIIVPAYNAEPFLGETLDKLLAINYPQLEIIVVNDGSQDGTAQIAARYAAEHECVSFINQPNGGVCRARNKGISHARGKYILPVDADDILLPGFVAWAVEQLEGDERLKVVVPKAEFFGDKQGEWRLPTYSPRLLARKNMIPATALYRRQDWVRVGGYNENLQVREDWEFWISILKDGGDVVTSPELGLRYRIRQTSKRMTDRKQKRNVVDELNERHPEFFQRELCGPLHYQRTWSRLLNKLYALCHPRRLCIDESNADCQYFIEAWPQIFRTRLGSVIYKRRNELRLLSFHGREFVVKQFAVPNIINRLVYGRLRKSKAQRSYEYASLLLSKGIGSPKPVAWMTVRDGLLFGRSYYVALKSDCHYTYNDILAGTLDSEEERRYLVLIAQATARLHDEGMVHMDFSRGNILFGNDRVEFIDLNRIRFHEVGIEEGCRNFAERLPATVEQRRTMADAYAQARGFDPQTCLRLMMEGNKEKE